MPAAYARGGRVRRSGALGAEELGRDLHSEREGGVAVPVRVREHLDAEAVAERQQHRRDGLGVAVQADDAFALLRPERLSQMRAPAAAELGQLGADLLGVARSR
jgi:hypothetical protein